MTALDVDRWVYVTMPHATFALGIKGVIVVIAPPIAKWTIGRHQGVVSTYYKHRGATFADC
jgi:hypothetical protein